MKFIKLLLNQHINKSEHTNFWCKQRLCFYLRIIIIYRQLKKIILIIRRWLVKDNRQNQKCFYKSYQFQTFNVKLHPIFRSISMGNRKLY